MSTFPMCMQKSYVTCLCFSFAFIFVGLVPSFLQLTTADVARYYFIVSLLQHVAICIQPISFLRIRLSIKESHLFLFPTTLYVRTFFILKTRLILKFRFMTNSPATNPCLIFSSPELDCPLPQRASFQSQRIQKKEDKEY